MVRDIKRLTISTIMGFLLLSGLFGAFGFAAATDNPAGVPGTWTLPEQRVGDRAAYTLQQVEGYGLNVHVLQPEHLALGFQWLEPTTILDAEGDLHDVNVLLESTPPNRARNVVSNIAYHIDRGDRSMAAYTYDSSLPWLDAEGEWQDGSPDSYYRQVNTVSDGAIHVTECMGNVLVSGQTLDLSERQVLFGPCSFHSYWNGDVSFRAIGVDQIGGEAAVHFAAWRGSSQDPSHVAHAWFTETKPYPVRFAAQSQEFPERFAVYSMASYRPGTGPAITWDGAEAVSLPPVEWLPRGEYGPSEAGIDHAFPLSEAIDRAKEHTDADGLRNYLAARPDAYVARFSYDQRIQDSGEEHSWYVEYTDGASGYAFHFTRSETAATTGLVPILDEEGGLAYRFSESNPTNSEWWPTEAVPDTLPSVASMWARWEALATGPFAGEQPNAWGMSMWCGYDPCNNPTIAMTAGVVVDDAREGENLDSELEWFRSGHTERPDEWQYNERVNRGAAVTAGGGDQEQPDEAIDTADLELTLALWKFPTSPGAVVGAGFASIGAAVLYYLWPAVKGLAGGLFSRVHDPEEMLQHPVRRSMHEAIQAHPGIHIRKLRDILETGRGATDHHLRKLESVGLVSRVQQEGYTCLFVKGMTDHRIMQAAPVLKARGAQFLLEAVMKTPGATGADVTRATGLSAGTVNYHMKRLEQAGLLDVKREGGKVLMWPTAVAQSVAAGSNAVAA